MLKLFKRTGERVMSKKTICMPVHLDEEQGAHAAQQAYERGWSNSQYLRYLVIADYQRHEDDLDLTAGAMGIDRERIDLKERRQQKTPSAS